MIRQQITDFFVNFFLQIEINTLNLPYARLPRPHRSNPVSKLVMRLTSQDWLSRLVGFNLAAGLIVLPLGSQTLASQTHEPSLNIVLEGVTEDSMVAPLTTTVREYVMPVPMYRNISQRFKAGHPGYDITGTLGADVVAFTSGRVAQIEAGQFGLGKYVVLDHGHGLISVYGHLRSFAVNVGDHVKTGQKIGELGLTGYTTGPHVHFEIHDGTSAVNPSAYLKL